MADKILAIIRSGPVTTKEIHGRTHRRHKAEELDRALGKLTESGLIEYEKVATGGRPADRWTLA